MRHAAAILALFVIVGLAGCASNDDLEAVRATAMQANATADEALATSRRAEDTAQEAKATADNTASRLDDMSKGQKSKRK